MNKPLMPLATAVWLVDNTSLTFQQIARFCGLHKLEIQGIADETVGQNIVGIDPTASGQLTRDEIERCSADRNQDLQIVLDEVPAVPRTKGPRYTPVSKRQDKPSAIAWLLRHHPELTNGQIQKLVGTTKPTISAIRDRTHWNIQNIQPTDPVGLGLSTQAELDEAVQKAVKRQEREEARARKKAAKQDKKKKGSVLESPSADDVPNAVAENSSADSAGATVPE